MGHFENGMENSSISIIPFHLRWMTNSIEYHGIHRLNVKIPCYRLRDCLNNAPAGMFASCPRVTIADGLYSLQFAAWDEVNNTFVTWRTLCKNLYN